MLDPKQKKLIIVGIVLCIIFVISITFSTINIGSDKILQNVKIQYINVARMTQADAKEMLEGKFEEKKKNQIKLKHNDFETTISLEQLDVTTNIDDKVQEAYSIGRIGNIITNNYAIMSSLIMKRNIPLDIKMNDVAIDDIVNDIESKLPDRKQDYTYSIEGNELVIKPGTTGVIVKKEDLKKSIKEKIRDFEDLRQEIKIPVSTEEPSPIDIVKIVEEIKTKPQDAYVTTNPTKIHVEKKGIELGISIEEAKEILKEQKEEYVLPLKITEPSVTVASLGEKAFTDKLSRFTTNYDASNKNRDNNLKIAAEKLNGTIISPGETFSYNKTIGARTIAAGFKEANAYSGGEVVLDVGGGICQLSSTLYNAVLLTNLKITERHNHSLTTSYVQAGRDATVAWGSLDFKFENDRNFPIKIEATARDGVVNISIYGVKEDNDYTVLIDTKTLNITEKKTEYKQDNTLAPGEEVVERKGSDGITSETYKTLLKNGVIISKETISKDTYSPLSQVIRRNKQ